MIEIINKPLLFYLVGYLYYWQMGFNSVFKGLSSDPFAILVISDTLFPSGVRFVSNILLAYIWPRNARFHIPIRSPIFYLSIVELHYSVTCRID